MDVFGNEGGEHAITLRRGGGSKADALAGTGKDGLWRNQNPRCTNTPVQLILRPIYLSESSVGQWFDRLLTCIEVATYVLSCMFLINRNSMTSQNSKKGNNSLQNNTNSLPTNGTYDATQVWKDVDRNGSYRMNGEYASSREFICPVTCVLQMIH